MTTAFNLTDVFGQPRRYIIVRYAKSYVIWDRHLKDRVGGYYRSFENAEYRMLVLNKEIRG